MQTQKVFMPKDKTLVICDYRESEVAKQLALLGAKINKANLEVGDFVCSKSVAVERKNHSDFVSSIIDGRVFEQAKLLKEGYKNPLIIIEGYSNREINPNAFYATIAALMTDGISMLWTKNVKETARAIFWIAKKEQSKMQGGDGILHYDIGMKVGKKPKEMKKLQEHIVSSLPGVSTKISKRLLERFGSVEAVFSASESELQKVQSVGKKLAKTIKEIASKTYA